MVIISFSGQDDMEKYIQRASELLEKYANAKNTESQIV